MNDLEFEQLVARERIRRAAAAQSRAYERAMIAACGDVYLRHAERAARTPAQQLVYDYVGAGIALERAQQLVNELR